MISPATIKERLSSVFEPAQANVLTEIFSESYTDLVKTGDFTLGKPLEIFEKNFAKLIGAKYAVGVNSGTDAIKLSLKVLNIKDGDEVITAANTFVATLNVVSAGIDLLSHTQSAFNSINVQIQVDNTQNTRLTVIEDTNASQNVRLDFSNTRMDISDNVNLSQNVRLDFSNTRMNIIEGVNAGQNTAIDSKVSKSGDTMTGALTLSGEGSDVKFSGGSSLIGNEDTNLIKITAKSASSIIS
jgi:hypothetical protein